MNVGRALVSTALRTGKLNPFLAAGMDATWLQTREARAVLLGEDFRAYRSLLDYHHEHGKLNQAVFEKDYPTYRLDRHTWKSSEVVAEVRQAITRRVVLDMLNTAELVHEEGDLGDAVGLLLESAAKLRSGVLRGKDSGHMELLNALDFDSFIEDFIGEGIPFGIEQIDEAYGGGQAGQLITLVGRQKSTKSTLMAWSAIAAWQHDYELIFYNVELDMQFMRQKLLSIGAHVNPERMRRGPQDHPRDRAKWEEEKARLREFYATLDELPFRIAQKFSRFTVADVAKDIDLYKPHAVYIDGFYFMEDEEGDSAAANHKAIEHIAGDLKALAMEKQVAIYVSTQAQEKQQGKKKQPGIEARTIQGGTGLLKASDLVLGIDIDDNKNVYINQIHNRYGQVDPVKLTWDWDVMEMKISEVNFDEFDV